jgi:hypothetical protein
VPVGLQGAEVQAQRAVVARDNQAKGVRTGTGSPS